MRKKMPAECSTRWSTVSRRRCVPRCQNSKYEVRAAIDTCYPGATVMWPPGMFPAGPNAADLEATFGIEIDEAFA